MELERLEHELAPLEESHTEMAQKSQFRTSIAVWGGLGFMALQFGILARLTWWEYSWDIMEPVTYFVGYGTAIAFYAYFVLTRQVLIGFNFKLIVLGQHLCSRNTHFLMSEIVSICYSCIGFLARRNLM